MQQHNILVMGGGAWGVALALVAHRAGHKVALWAREGAGLQSLQTNRCSRTLRNVKLPNDIEIVAAPFVNDPNASHALARATAKREAYIKLGAQQSQVLNPEGNISYHVVILAVPAQNVRDTLAQYAAHLNGQNIIIAAKGFEITTGRSMPQVVQEICPNAHVFMLSGPSFASDVALGKPTAVVIAGQNAAQAMCEMLCSTSFRPYWSDDITGVALGGALKNIYAIAAGVCMGLGLGESARAAILARSFAELQKLSLKLGAKSETLLGLSGFGDLVLTATSTQSRNFRFGVALGGGKTMAQASAEIGLAEGVHTAQAFGQNMLDNATQMPILMGVYAIVTQQKSPAEVMQSLLSRPLKSEF